MLPCLNPNNPEGHAVNFDEEITDKDGNEYTFEGVTVITLKLGKATHAQDFLLNSDEEIRKAWGE